MEETAKYLEAIGLTVELQRTTLYEEEYDMGLKGLASFSVSDWYNEYSSASVLSTNIFGGEPLFDEAIANLNRANTLQERSDALIKLQELDYETLYKFPLFIMGQMVYTKDNLVVPSDIEFGDTKYAYDMNFAEWQIKY